MRRYKNVGQGKPNFLRYFLLLPAIICPVHVQGLVYPSCYDVLRHWTVPEERSRTGATVLTGKMFVCVRLTVCLEKVFAAELQLYFALSSVVLFNLSQPSYSATIC